MGCGSLHEEIQKKIVPSESEADFDVIALDCARDPDTVSTYVSRSDCDELYYVFADGQLLFFLEGGKSEEFACPRCILYHLAKDTEQFSRLKEPVDVEPQEETVKLASDIVRDELETLRTDPSRKLTAIDVQSEGWLESSVSMRHPECPHPWSTTTDRSVVLDEQPVEKLLDRLYDEQVGLYRDFEVNDVDETATAGEKSFTLARVWYENPGLCYKPDFEDRFEIAGGAHPEPRVAKIKSLMECIERYSLLVPSAGDVKGSEKEIDETVTPREIHFYSKEQYRCDDFPFDPYDPDEQYRWTKCRHASTGEEVYVPVEFLYFTKKGGDGIMKTNSSGCAAHFDKNQALSNAIFELYERSAVMDYWYFSAPQPHLRVESLPDDLREYIDSHVDPGCDIFVFDITQNAPFYSFIFLIANEKGAASGPTYSIGSACHFDQDAAIRDAADEAFDIFNFCKFYDVGSRDDKTTVGRPGEHFEYYQPEDNFEFIRENLLIEDSIPYSRTSGPTPTYENIVKEAERLGDDIYTKDITPVNLSHLKLFVVNSFSPDLVPISYGYHMNRIGKGSSDTPDVNWPEKLHPFP